MAFLIQNIEISVFGNILEYEKVKICENGFFFTRRNKCFTITICQGTEILEKVKR